MAIEYLTKTDDEREAERRDDMTYDAWGRDNYAAYRAEWDAHLAQLRQNRYAAWIANGKSDLVARMERYAALIEANDAPPVTVQCDDPLPF